MAATPSREHLLFMAKVAEQAERFDEMTELMKQLVAVADTDELTTDERNYLSVANKNAIGSRRASWRILDSIRRSEESSGNERRVNALKSFISKVESEISSICDGVLNLLDSKLLPSASSTGYNVFYLKMKGDYNRYLAEFKSGLEREEVAEKARSAYEAAQNIANEELSPANPIRLGLELNLSVFYLEILASPGIAMNFAQQAVDRVEKGSETLGEESALIMKIIHENLTLWKFHTQDPADQ